MFNIVELLGVDEVSWFELYICATNGLLNSCSILLVWIVCCILQSIVFWRGWRVCFFRRSLLRRRILSSLIWRCPFLLFFLLFRVIIKIPYFHLFFHLFGLFYLWFFLMKAILFGCLCIRLWFDRHKLTIIRLIHLILK